MPPAERDAERQEPGIVDLPETSVSSEDAAQVKAGGEVLLQPIVQLSPFEAVSTERAKLKTVVNGTVEIDGTSTSFANETFGIGGGSAG